MADAMQVGFRTVDGVRVRCAESTGPSAPSILLTSPWPESVYAFAPIWPSLANVARLVAVDLPGFGRSERRDGGPRYGGPLLEMDSAQVRQAISEHVVQALEVARNTAGKMRPGGTLLLMGGTGSRRVGHGLGIASAATAALPPFTAALALELAPVRVNLIAAGFVDTPLSASLLGDRLEERRNELRAMLPIGRVVGPADVAALAVHIMSNTAVTGATYDIDGGQQFVSS